MLKKFNFNIAYAILLTLCCILLSTSMVSAGQVIGNTFADIQNEVNNPLNGGTVDLTGGTTYSNNGNSRILVHNQNIVIQGINGKATLDANLNSYIFNVNSTSTITFRNINFINGNSSINPGGAILAHSTVIIEDCTFENNYGQSGAAIMINPLAIDSKIRNCNFTNNYGIYEHHSWGWGEGAAIDTHADDTLIENCLFENNYVKNNGGAISSALGSNNEIINCTFINNTAGNNGGAILVRDSTARIEDCTFINNSALYGSAIFNDQDSDLDIWNCIFTDNFAGTYDIIAPEYIVNTSTNAIIEISLVLGDNILDAIYNDQGIVTVNGTPPDELDSSPDQNITLSFEGVDYVVATNGSGVAVFTIPTNTLTSGVDYPYTVTYNETTLYESIDKTSKIIVDDGATDFGSVPGTGGNTITGPKTDIPTQIPPTPPTPPYIPPTNSNPTTNNNPTTTSKTSSTVSITIVKKTAPKKGVTVETKKKTSTNKNGPIKVKTSYSNQKVKGVLTHHKVTTYQNYSNGKKVGNEYTKKTNVTKQQAYFSKDISLGLPAKLNLGKKTNKNTTEFLKDVIYSDGSKTALNNKQIRKQVVEIFDKIDGKLTPRKKAEALFNWTRDKIRYEYPMYYGTKYKAPGTLSKGKGNCVDQSHLLVTMLRMTGIPAKYENYNGCVFSSGLISGHVWTNAYIGKWVKMDTTSSRNSVNIIKNFKYKSYNAVNGKGGDGQLSVDGKFINLNC